MIKPTTSKADQPPVQTPRQYQPGGEIGRQYVFGYSRCIRNTNWAVRDLFADITIYNEDDNTIYPVPRPIWGTQEKAAIFIFGEQFMANSERKEQGLVDRITLPAMGLQGGNIDFAEKRYIYHEARRKVGYGQEKRPYDVVYQMSKGVPIDMSFTLHVWARYYEHLMQIVEQILQKFSSIAYINVEGVPWETPVKLTGSTNNVDADVQDRQQRILRYSFNLMAESHIMQPIKRDKTALKITQKYTLLGDLMPSETIETITEEVKEGEVPQN